MSPSLPASYRRRCGAGRSGDRRRGHDRHGDWRRRRRWCRSRRHDQRGRRRKRDQRDRRNRDRAGRQRRRQGRGGSSEGHGRRRGACFSQGVSVAVGTGDHPSDHTHEEHEHHADCKRKIEAPPLARPALVGAVRRIRHRASLSPVRWSYVARCCSFDAVADAPFLSGEEDVRTGGPTSHSCGRRESSWLGASVCEKPTVRAVVDYRPAGREVPVASRHVE